MKTLSKDNFGCCHSCWLRRHAIFEFCDRISRENEKVLKTVFACSFGPQIETFKQKNSQNLVALSLKPENSVVFRKRVIFGHRKVRLWVQRVFLFSIAAYILYIFLPVVVKLVSETRKYATAKVRFKWLSAGNYSSMLYAHSSTFNMRTANTRIINNTLTLVCLHSCMDKNYWLCAYYSTSMLSATWCQKKHISFIFHTPDNVPFSAVSINHFCGLEHLCWSLQPPICPHGCCM